MLLDLGRNDVGRVAARGTVEVTDSFTVERYSHVMHIVSNVVGRLDPAKDALDALFAGFPAGTVSGAPKVRACEIIAELEPEARGPYAGGVGYFAPDGTLDSCIVLRTGVVKDGTLHVQAGAGIVADSDPEYEQRECEAKAGALIAAAREAARHRAGTRVRAMRLRVASRCSRSSRPATRKPGGEPVTRIDLENPGLDTPPSPTPTPTVASACETVTFEDAQFTALRRRSSQAPHHDRARQPALPRLQGASPKLGPPTAPTRRVRDERRHVRRCGQADRLLRQGRRARPRAQPQRRCGQLPHEAQRGVLRHRRQVARDDRRRVSTRRSAIGPSSAPRAARCWWSTASCTRRSPTTVRAARSATAWASIAAGRAHFVISEGPVSFGKLARYFRDVLKMPNALYLDGSVSELVGSSDRPHGRARTDRADARGRGESRQ